MVPPLAVQSPITCAEGAGGVNCEQVVSVPATDTGPRVEPVASITMTGDELRTIGSSPDEWIAFAQRSAGTSVGDAAIYVDGVLARGTPPASSIARISVNVDPFSPEYGGVDQLRIDIDSRPPDRRWRVQAAMPSLGGGGHSPLATSEAPVSRGMSGGLSGPVGGTPLTFLLSASERVNRHAPVFADAISGRVRAAQDGLRLSTRASSIRAGLVLATPRVLARFTGSSARMETDHSGVGGINAASTGRSIATADDHGQATWRVARAAVLHRGGATLSRSRVVGAATAGGPSVVVTGQASRGSNELAASRHDYVAWDAKHVVLQPGGTRPWLMGLEARHTAIRDERTWNSYGRLQLPSLASSTGTLTVVRGDGKATAGATAAAVFGEQTVWRSHGATLRTGGRLEWQDGDGFLLSPRLSAGALVRGFHVSGGAGLFVQPWAPDVFATAALRSANGVEVLVMPGVTVEAAATGAHLPGERLSTIVAPSYTRRRDVLLRAGVERRAGPVRFGAERAWTVGRGLTGTVRQRGGGGLVDTVDSDRRLRRTRTHARVSASAHGHSIVARYEHVLSRDDTDIMSSLPALQNDIAGEWAPSASMPRHTVTLTAGLALPAAVRMTITYDARSGARYNVISGTDDEGLAAFTGRAGLPRNAGVLPATRTLSMYVARSIRTKLLPRLTVDLGARADNVLNRENITLVGRVLGSTLFGEPMAAAPGRAFRIWVSLRR